MDDEQQDAGGGSAFTRKLGPLPMWQWLAIITAAALAYYFLVAKKQTAAASASDTSTGAATTSAADVPQFVIQNQIPSIQIPTPVAAPAATAAPVNVTVNDNDVPAPAAPSAPAKAATSPKAASKPAGHGTVHVLKYTTKNPPWQSTISGIAAHYGIRSWQTVWNDPHNASLRAKRKDPKHIQAGDTVYVP